MGKRMINYSVYMMRNSLKPNLPEKAYAKAQVKEVMSFRDFVAHIAEHGGYKRGQVKGCAERHVLVSRGATAGGQEGDAR